jgi:tetratricopeptide (TPR) repeat protein
MQRVRQAFGILGSISVGVSTAAWLASVIATGRGDDLGSPFPGGRRYLNTDAALLDLSPRIDVALGTETPAAAYLIDRLGLAAEQAGRFAEAETYYRRALEIREVALGPRDLATAQSCLHLASLFRRRGDHAREELYLVRVLSIAEQAAGQQPASGLLGSLVSRLLGDPVRRSWIDVLTIAALDGLGSLHREAGRLAQARPLVQRAVELVSEPDAPPSARATVFANAGLLAHDLGQYPEAEQWHRRALGALSAEGERADPIRAGIWNDIASVQLALHRHTEARRSLRKAQELLGAEASGLFVLRATVVSNAAKLEALFHPTNPQAPRTP